MTNYENYIVLDNSRSYKDEYVVVCPTNISDKIIFSFFDEMSEAGYKDFGAEYDDLTGRGIDDNEIAKIKSSLKPDEMIIIINNYYEE